MISQLTAKSIAKMSLSERSLLMINISRIERTGRHPEAVARARAAFAEFRAREREFVAAADAEARRAIEERSPIAPGASR